MTDSPISDHDMYQLSKYFPGQYCPHGTYSPSGQMTANRALRSGLSISQGAHSSSSGVNRDLGATTHTIIMYCPVLSHIAVSDANSCINGKQASGLVVLT